MNRTPFATAETLAPAPAKRGLLSRIALHLVLLAGAGIAFVAHEHFKLENSTTASLVSLVAAAVLAVAPLRAIIGEVFAIEGKVLHALHGLGGLAVMGLVGAGAVSGAPLLNHAALAPFAIMGAAQALMHPNNPRSAEQAAAMRRFASSLPEVAQIGRPGALTSPAGAVQSVKTLQDIISKAQALGETELKADPAFQSALAQATTRTGLTLGLDSVDQALNKLAANPATAAAVPELRRRLAQARALARGSAKSAVSP